MDNEIENERIDIETMEARIRLWREGDISDEDLALEMDYMVPELKRCYEELDRKNKWLEELDRCPTCGKEGFWATDDSEDLDEECRRCGREISASE